MSFNLNKRASFGKTSKYLDKLSDFLFVQNNSFKNFLFNHDSEYSLKSLIHTFFPLSNSFNTCRIEFLDYRIEMPKYNVDQCKKKSITYAAEIYATFRFVISSKDKDTGELEVVAIKDQEIHFLSMPMMTDDGTFVVNGFERVVVSQLHRAPGVFFVRNIVDGVPCYTANIAPYNGSWISIIFDGKDSLLFRVDKRKKLPIYHFFVAMGMTNHEILNEFYSKITITRSSKKDLWEVSGLNFDTVIGGYLQFSIRDENGNILHPKNVLFTKKTLRDIKNLKVDKFFVDFNDIEGSITFSDLFDDEKSGMMLRVGSKIDLASIEKIRSSKINKIELINSSYSTYNSSIADYIEAFASVSRESIIKDTFNVIRPGDPFSIDIGKNLVQKMFMSSGYYNLSEAGRYRINKSLGIENETSKHLTHKDIFLTVKKLIDLREKNMKTDDIDSLSNRRVRSVGELMYNRFSSSMSKVVRSALEKMNSMSSESILPSDVIMCVGLSKAMKDFLMSDQMSQYMDQTNPMSSLSHKRRISSLGVGGLQKERAGFEVRDIHQTHYGRICAIETPEGPSIGLVTALAMFASVDKYGSLTVPYFRVKDRKITSEVVYLDSMEERESVVCNYSYEFFKDGKITKDMVDARKNGEFAMVHADDVSFIDVSPLSIVSVTACLLVFMQHVDSKRALMGANMQKQAVVLVKPASPLIASGAEAPIAQNSGILVKAKRPGIVKFVDSKMVIVHPIDENKEEIHDVDVYYLRKFEKTNQKTCFNQRPIVSRGQVLENGGVIADCSSSQNGELALGSNVLVAFMSWNGLSFEDSVVISSRIANDDAFTSIHIDEYEVSVRDTKFGAEQITKDIPDIASHKIEHLDESGVAIKGSYVTAGDILVGKVIPKHQSPVTPEEKLLSHIFGEKSVQTKDTSLRVPSGVSGTVIDIQILTRAGDKKSPRAELIENERVLEARRSCDRQKEIIAEFFDHKLTNILADQMLKLGGKKIVMDKEEMRSISFTDKLKITSENESINKAIKDIKQNYATIVDDLNKKRDREIEYILEGDDLQAGVFKVVKVLIAYKSRIQSGDKVAGRHGNKGVISRVVNQEDMPFMDDGRSVDMILNPLGVPSRMNIGQILECHLGMVSFEFGRMIDSQLSSRRDIKSLKETISKALSGTDLESEISSMLDDEVLDLCSKHRNGVYYSCPIFEGPSYQRIESLLESCGLNKTGKVMLRDGLTGEPFDYPITVGVMYILKLNHLVENKIHARSVGSYGIISQQPLGGRGLGGGQRVGEMEVWAVEAYGASHVLREFLSIKSDDIVGRNKAYQSVLSDNRKHKTGVPESFNITQKSIESLGFKIKVEYYDD